MSNVFVIIVTYNGKHWYDRCFTSLRASELPVQVVVIDNASSDDTVPYIQTNYPEIHIIESSVNLGFGQGNNKGMRFALDQGAEYVFLLNQDAWIEPNTLSKLVDIHKKHLEYGILSPIHLNATKTAIEKGLIVYLTKPSHTPNEIISDFYLGLKKEVYDTNFVNAAAWLLPRKTVETIGGFDPIFYHYGEDDNYLSRVLYHGLKVGIVPSVTICHDTERALIKKSKQSMTFDKWLLQSATDLMNPVSLKQQIKNYQKQALAKLLFFNFSTFKENHTNAKFLLKHSKKIQESINQNKIKGANWL